MPTKRRFILFLIVLTLMLLIKRAVGQESAVAWDPVSCWGCASAEDVEVELYGSMVAGILGGAIVGISRVIARRSSYFSGDLIELRLQ